ncbi:MAG: hypothetical protein JRI68_28170 [Deltaproteobacteria bacterium]|nr:hypothetical protein [Deltaproteobacteria bacterium]
MASSACGGDGETGPAPGEGGGGFGGGIPLPPPDAGPQEWPCEAGELELEDGTCLPAGVPDGACGQGFASDGEGGCVAILPEQPCGPGTFAIPGETACHEVAPCGSGTYGDIPVDGTTQHVDGSYTGGDEDGTASKPWLTIQAGIDAAEPNAIVAVAAGSYTENLVIQSTPVRLWGKCPAEVEIVGDGNNGAVVFVHDGSASGSELRDLAVTGGSTAVLVDGATDVVVDRIWVHDPTWIGIYAHHTNAPTSVTVSRSLVEGAVSHGGYALGATVTLTESVIRDTEPDGDGHNGAGIYAFMDESDMTPASLQITRSVLKGNNDYAVRVLGSTATIEDTLIRDTAPLASDGERGEGVHIQESPTVATAGDALLRGVVIEDSHRCGLCAFNADIDMERVVVRDVAKPPAADYAIPMLMGVDGAIPNFRPSISIRSSTVERGTFMGVGVVSVDAVLEGLIVRDMEGDEIWGMGRGVSIESDPAIMQHAIATVRGLVVERVSGFGFVAIGAEVTVESAAVRDVAAETVSQMFGRGIGFELEQFSGVPTIGKLSHAVVERATEGGITVVGSEVEIDSVIVRDTQPRPIDGGLGRGVLIQLSMETERRSTASVAWSLVERSHEVGIMVLASDAQISHTIVRASGTMDEAALFGDGIVVYAPTDLQWRRYPASAETTKRAGVSSFAADVSMGGMWIDCNTIDINGEMIQYYPFDFTNTGGNRCGCGDETWPCQVLSSNLSPPPIE